MAPPPQTPTPTPVIAREAWDGCSVLLDINDGDRLAFFRLPRRVHDKQRDGGADGQAQDETRDNRSLVDNNTAQTLSNEDIEAMKREGASGDAIVEALIANSSTFGNKTVFSQEKYKLKKQKKYAPKVLLRRPSARSICETYFKKYPARIGSGDAPSVLSGSIQGDVVETAVYQMRLFSCPRQNQLIQQYQMGMRSQQQRSPIDIEVPEPATDEHLNQGDISMLDCKGSNGNSIAPKRREAGKAPSPERMKYWGKHGFSSLIVAAPGHEVESVVADLLPLLSYSAPFAYLYTNIFMWFCCYLSLFSGIYMQPLATCMHSLQVSKMAIGLQITEPWLREYQVLPSRTHPHMQMNAFGGYILSGIRIHKPDPSEARMPEKSSCVTGVTESMLVL
ncbi:putative tRNA (guanine-N(1)-)-methyltransferase,putative [Hordeum vulgare]|nr:putative tRNA (guanine-N(1)-)-methyltransferase,putative [Hordeum vulgare]